MQDITFVSENISFTFLNFFTLEMAYQSDEIYLNEIDLTDENENNTTTKGSANVLNFIPQYLFWFTVPTVYKHSNELPTYGIKSLYVNTWSATNFSCFKVSLALIADF